MSRNKVELIGYLGSTPKAHTTKKGAQIATFSLATNEKYKNSDGEPCTHTEWHSVVAFGKRANTCIQYLKKGSHVFLEGALRTKEYSDKEGVKKKATKISLSLITFLDRDRSPEEISEESPLDTVDDSTDSGEDIFELDDINV